VQHNIRATMIELLNKWHWRLVTNRDHPGFLRILEDLNRERTLSADAWRNLNRQRLRQLLIYSRDKVPYYGNLFAERGFRPENCDLQNSIRQIPILTKDIIRTKREMLIADGMKQSDMFENSTGGSTGIPQKFWQDERYVTTAVALDVYVRRWWGISPFARTASIWGADRVFHELSFRDRFYNWRHRRRSMNAFRMTEPELSGFCRMLRQWKPPYLIGYASALDTLARFADMNGFGDLRFKAIRSAAEMLWPEQRSRIENVFQSPVYNFYGSREVNNIAAECPEHHSLHLISTWRFLEIVDGSGQVVPAGQVGYVCVTDLSNRAMPFIRYRNEDMASLSPHPCPCGRPSPVIKHLVGRSSDVIHAANGELIHGEFFTHLFYGRDDVRQFQVHQTSLNQLIVRYVADAPSAHEFIKRTAESIRKRMGGETVVCVELCDAIPLPSSGKHRFTISDVPFYPPRSSGNDS
jgi:phenylacetate-coenzyme A ligase PaaK-like adenylate-forming protein